MPYNLTIVCTIGMLARAVSLRIRVCCRNIQACVSKWLVFIFPSTQTRLPVVRIAGRERAHHRRIAVVGLGYVGLPVAAAFSRSGSRVVSFDISSSRIQELRAGYDRTKELTSADLAREELYLTDDPDDVRAADFFIITVPAPIDDAH